MLGHASVRQTEAYAITEQATIGREMSVLNRRLNKTKVKMSPSDIAVLTRLEKEIQTIKMKYSLK
ncbi:hypothetical protein [Flavobacterium limi]|uniref:Uncharacterized protein n=1 Tax=Flavobacterium limi TaxID=2045105 RepID=A0ABQ1UZ18_9FLAO|nr:hypothetical protein [Flavobacterium limi]GGF28855.1 hypothetical protein GCM10011518_42690 [Flavobacterium limi]